MLVLDYIINLSIFALMVVIPLVVRSWGSSRPFKRANLFFSIYGGIVSCILISLAIQQQGYSYDIRYVPVILSFAYLGPAAGMITGTFALGMRLAAGGSLIPVIIGWIAIMLVFSILHIYLSRLTIVKKCAVLFGAYAVIYIINVPILFKVFRNEPVFHLQYLLFVMLGVILGVSLIESYMKLYRIIREKKEMEQILAASEAKYRLIAENMTDLIKVMDRERRISYFSPSHQAVLGYEYTELENIELCRFIHPDDLDMFKASIERMLAGDGAESMEFRFRHKQGVWVDLESHCMPVKGETGTIEHIVLVSRDISERRKAEEVLLQSEKLSVVGELAAGVAHEIRNPLTTIKGFIQLYKQENQASMHSDLLLGELERIEAITSELLSLGKPQAVQVSQANVRELMEGTLELLSPQAHMNNIQFRWSCGQEELPVICEQNQMRQVFLNILKNAMESMHKGGVIDVGLHRMEEKTCIISIQDHGCGIPEDLLPRLGEPFYTLKEKGTGLGLMICHKIIKQHHGTITYKSKVGEGTLVEIRLPLVH